ncbi:hypothetical protein RCJ96_26730 [Bacillus sp. BSL6]
MDWLDKAASNAQKEQANVKEVEEKLRELKEAYPDHLMQLWNEFNSVFKKIEESFGPESTSIKAQENDLVIKIADVTIKAIAEQEELMGGYFASVDVTYDVKNASGGPELPYSTIYLTYDGEWVYRDRSLNNLVNNVFGKEQITEIVKNALWKYL